MKNSEKDKIKLAKLIAKVADYDSEGVDNAELFLKSEGIDVDQLISEGMKRISSMKKEISCNEVYSYSSIIKKLVASGLNQRLLEKIIPEKIRFDIQKSDVLNKSKFNEVYEYLHRVFKLKTYELFSDENIKLDDSHFQTAFFKTTTNPNINQIKAYSHYAFYLAEIVNKIFVKNPKYEYPGDIDEFKTTFYNAYDRLDFNNLVNFTWDMGIAVIPLDDSGIFHGASWNIDNYHVIVLKQKSKSHARWMFDLLHELYHVFVHLEDKNTSVLETDEMNPFRENNSEEEKEANSFSNQFVFKDDAPALAQEILNLSGNDIKLFKRSLELIVEKNNIRADFLANYLAFRLQHQNISWWGTAETFQVKEPSPFTIASTILKERISVDELDPIDKNLLMTAIEY
jgi:hypothetical protein